MGSSTPHITTAELRIMKVLWKLGTGTVRQALEVLGDARGDKPAYTTVMTMMNQLADKGALGVDRERQPFVYTPAVRKDQVQRQRVTQFLQQVFDGRAEDLVLHLAEQDELSTDDLRRIEAKIQVREEADAKATKRTTRRRKKKS